MADKDAIAELQREKAALELRNRQLQEQQARLCAVLEARDGLDAADLDALKEMFQSSQASFQFLADNASEAIFVSEDENTHLYVNRQATALTGYSREELMKLTVPRLLPEDQHEKVLNLLHKRLADVKEPSVFETIVLRKDGVLVPVEVASARTMWEGKVSAVAFVRDISSRKSTERALRESEERFRLVTENTQDLICLQKLDGSLIYASPSCRALLGYAPEELMSLPLHRLYHPEDLDMVISQREQAAKRGRALSRLVYRIRHRDGQYVWFESDTSPILDEHGLVALLLTSSRDVTQRKKMEIAFSSRAMELNCLLQITELVEQHRGSTEQILQNVADFLPGSWQHAQDACGRIVVRDRQYTSRNYRRSPWRLGAEIMVDEKSVGCVEVYYRHKHPDADEGPFTWEERRLLSAVAERLANIVQRAEAEQELQKERQALRESNIAMRELMARIQEEKREIAQAMQNNVDTVILPILEDLHNRLPVQHRRLIDVLRFNLEEVTSPFVDRVSQAFENLSPAELRVCDMIRRGLASKEIAHVLHISPSTVSRHREHIRQKLGLTNKGTNLISHLNAMMTSRGREA